MILWKENSTPKRGWESMLKYADHVILRNVETLLLEKNTEGAHSLKLM